MSIPIELHDHLPDYVANEHIDWVGDAGQDIHINNIPDLSSLYEADGSVTTHESTYNHSDYDTHLALTNEHIDWTGALAAFKTTTAGGTIADFNNSSNLANMVVRYGYITKGWQDRYWGSTYGYMYEFYAESGGAAAYRIYQNGQIEFNEDIHFQKDTYLADNQKLILGDLGTFDAYIQWNGSGYLDIYSVDIRFSGDIHTVRNTWEDNTGVIYRDGECFIHTYKGGNATLGSTLGRNVFIGVNCGNFSTGDTATASYQGSSNVAVGYNCLQSNTLGYYNFALGVQALLANTTGSSNFGCIYGSLKSNISGSDNIAIGYNSLLSNETGSGNYAIGNSTLKLNVTGGHNAGIGSSALQSNIGSYNFAFGLQAMQYKTTGNYNLAMGPSAAKYLANGTTQLTLASQSIYIGGTTKAFVDNPTNEIVIGYGATGHGSNTITIGNDDITDNYFNGNLHLNAGVTYSVATKTANYTVTDNDHYLELDGTSNTVDGTLPASPTTGHEVKIKCINNDNACRVLRNEKTIDGAVYDITLSLNDSVTLIYNGTGWRIL